MKRPVAVKVVKGAKPPCPDPVFGGKYPTISLYMTDGQWEDGKTRELSTLAINFSSGTVNVGLSDHALQCSAYSTGETIEGCLTLLEESLASERPVWRPWKAGKK